MMKGYEQMMSQIAEQALPFWAIENSAITTIKIRENAVFKVKTPKNQLFALRIHRAGYHSQAKIKSELVWMAALENAGIGVPKVIPTVANELLSSIEGKNTEGGYLVDLFEWIDGQSLANNELMIQENLDFMQEAYHQIGALLANLHNQSAHWQLPQGFERHAWDAEGLVGKTPFWGKFWTLEQLTAPEKRRIRKAQKHMFSILTEMEKTPEQYGLIHADCIPDNVMVQNDKR